MRKLPFLSCDLYPHMILHLHSKLRFNRPIWRQDIARNDFQYGVLPPSWIWKISIFWQMFVLGIEICILLIKIYLNRIIHAWDIEIKLFSKWQPSAILNLRKLTFWSRDLYLHVILHLRSKFHINWPIWCWDLAKKRFSILRPSAILTL